MSDMRLILSIVNFLRDESHREDLTADSRESLEVAVQCLQTAYDLDDITTPKYDPVPSLPQIFKDALGSEPEVTTEITDSQKSQAEEFKNEGNNLMKMEKHMEAVEAYTRAIEIDRLNAVYYCNRAAAYSRLNNYESAIADCKQAIERDPKYSKAYGRMGLAYVSLGKNDQAIDCYTKAIELDPSNMSYRINLKLAQENLTKQEQQSNPNLGNASVDVNDLFNNPVLRNMATAIMQDPNMINVISGLVSSSVNESGMGSLLQAGQQFAAQMQASNPQLIEQLRQQVLGNSNSYNPDTNDQSPN